MKLLSTVFFSLLMLCGCHRKLTIEKSVDRLAVDSNRYTEGVQLSVDTIPVPGDSLTYSVPVVVDPQTGRIVPVATRVTSGRVSFSAHIDTLNRLQVKINCNSYQLAIQRQNMLIDRYRRQIVSLSNTQREVVYKVPRWVWYVLPVCVVLSVASLTLYIKRVYR